MFKRKTRNSTAYTGVGLPSPSAQAPDNGAMAAALSIGKTLKQTRPEVYGKPNGSPSMTRYGPPKHTSSLLKRNSSFQNSIESTGSPTPRSRTGSNLSSRHSMAPTFNRQVYNVDDSFNDSFFEEVGHETDAHYSNEARLRDLKLHHQPPAPKMVKKYIPTPNGITVIEVPEESMKKEIARSNSMRTGLSINRAGSLRSGRSHSMTNAAKAKKPNRSRLSSMVNAPRIDEQSELDYQSAQSSRLVSRDSAELDELDRQIEHEKQLAEKLEQKRREYERLKKLRAENERKLRELQKLQEAETSSFKDMSSTFEEDLVSPVHNEKEVSSDLHGQSEPQAHPQKSPQVHSQKQQPQPQPQPQQQQPQPQTQSKAVGPNGSQAPHAELSESEEEDVPIAPLPFAVDELDSKKFTIASQPNGEGPRHDSQASIDTAEGVNEFVPQSTSPHDTVVNSYGDTFVAPKESDTSAVREDSTDNFGIEEVPTEAFESPNLASQLRPNFAPRRDSGAAESHTSAVSNISGESSAFPEDSSRQGSTPFFDPVPEIIGTYERDSPKLEATTGTTDDTLVPPPTLAGSIRSFSSLDSKSKPIKSAMKNKRPSYTSTTSAKESPAHQAYLSLTTAENTRLNSKLSASHLPEPNLGPESKPQPARSPNNQKRISQSLRKQASNASQGGLAGRSLRPQPVAEGQPLRPQGQPARLQGQPSRNQGGGMSNRNLKQTPQPMAPQPIAPHPTSKPNYQSPSKLRAAELYAKANSRPISEFQSVPRKSSFTRDSETPEKPTTANSQRPSHRTTLRSPRPLSQISNSPGPQIPPNQSSKQQYNGGFKSKFMDSDDELDTRVGGTHRNGGFSSRFVDSDDESRGTRIPSSQHATDYSAMQSLRNKEEKEPKEKSKEKKPKKKFLKKLFGRN